MQELETDLMSTRMRYVKYIKIVQEEASATQLMLKGLQIEPISMLKWCWKL